jgi:hypothetical protein
VSWEGRCILDGYAIADDYRMTTLTRELLVLGVNIRAYDAEKKVWNLKWLNALSGTWTDLGPQELVGVFADDKTISHRLKESVAPYAFLRATYTNVSADRFTWQGEGSDDLKTWEPFLFIALQRSER